MQASFIFKARMKGRSVVRKEFKILYRGVGFATARLAFAAGCCCCGADVGGAIIAMVLRMLHHLRDPEQLPFVPFVPSSSRNVVMDLLHLYTCICGRTLFVAVPILLLLPLLRPGGTPPSLRSSSSSSSLQHEKLGSPYKFLDGGGGLTLCCVCVCSMWGAATEKARRGMSSRE